MGAVTMAALARRVPAELSTVTSRPDQSMR
jgi:hypothetical protein